MRADVLRRNKSLSCPCDFNNPLRARFIGMKRLMSGYGAAWLARPSGGTEGRSFDPASPTNDNTQTPVP